MADWWDHCVLNGFTIQLRSLGTWSGVLRVHELPSLSAVEQGMDGAIGLAAARVLIMLLAVDEQQLVLHPSKL